jgi:hypothetical protein
VHRGVTVLGQAVGACCHEVGQKAEYGGADQIDQPGLDVTQPVGQEAVERVEHHVLVAPRHQGHGAEDHDDHQDFGELQAARHGVAEEAAPGHVDQGEPHDGEQGHRGHESGGPAQYALQRLEHEGALV